MYILLPKQYLTAQNNNYFLSFPQRIQRILVNSWIESILSLSIYLTLLYKDYFLIFNQELLSNCLKEKCYFNWIEVVFNNNSLKVWKLFANTFLFLSYHWIIKPFFSLFIIKSWKPQT